MFQASPRTPTAWWAEHPRLAGLVEPGVEVLDREDWRWRAGRGCPPTARRCRLPRVVAILDGTVSDINQIHGEFQTQIMAVLWRTGQGTVEQVRRGLPSRYRGAYTTAQTVLNRLTERGMLEREKVGKGFVYRPAISESDYVARSIERTLAGASSQARQTALAQLLGGIGVDELSDLQSLASEVEAKRKGKRPT